jgi:hypothetical protein
VISGLEDAKDYTAFEMAIKADYDAQTAVERDLILRLASLSWRLRRATAIESGLFQLQAHGQPQFRQAWKADQSLLTVIDGINRKVAALRDDQELECSESHGCPDVEATSSPVHDGFDDITRAFVRLASLSTYPLDRLIRYEAALWRQARQILTVLHRLDRRRPWDEGECR